MDNGGITPAEDGRVSSTIKPRKNEVLPKVWYVEYVMWYSKDRLVPLTISRFHRRSFYL